MSPEIFYNLYRFWYIVKSKKYDSVEVFQQKNVTYILLSLRLKT